VQGEGSAGGDFNFITYDVAGMRDQLCSGGDNIGARLNVGEYLWQEFIPGDPRVVLSTVNLKLSYNLEEPEDVYADIRDSNGNVIASSLPSRLPSGGGLEWVIFRFQTPLVLNRTQKYQILPRRSGYTLFPWIGVYWYYTDYNSYPHGSSAVGNSIDFSFTTDANGFPDQTQTSGSPLYPRALSSYPPNSPWQEFIPLAQ
jgi:hypothetical protein